MKNITPVRAIKLKCLECSGNAKEVKLCTMSDCPLFEYRLGTNPGRKGIGGRKTAVSSKKLT
jgi:hypothetical protein